MLTEAFLPVVFSTPSLSISSITCVSESAMAASTSFTCASSLRFFSRKTQSASIAETERHGTFLSNGLKTRSTTDRNRLCCV